MAMISWWPYVCLSLIGIVSATGHLEFDPFFAAETAFFSPQQEHPFGGFTGYAFNPPGGTPLIPDYQVPFASETSNIPIYTDGVATAPQITLSQLEKDYKGTLHRLVNARSATSIRSRQRIPKFVSEPFPSASSISERHPQSHSSQKLTDGPRIVLPKSQTVELHTGFIPIIKGSSQEQRGSKDLASTVIKDIEPPILTAAPGSLTSRPNLLTVSASVQSSSKVSFGSQRGNGTSSNANELKARPRTSFSRFLDFPHNETRTIGVSTTSSESIVSRVASRPESILDLQQKDLYRLSPSSSTVIFEENKVAEKSAVDIDCEGSQDLGWCELGDKYPRKYVNRVISSCKDAVERMHVELPHSFEKLSDASDFKAELDNSSRRSAKERGSHDAWSWAAYSQQGSLCDAETGFLRPETAKDTTGKWNIIVQTDSIKQRVPIEMCRKTNSSCKKMLNCGLKSQCLQKYNYHLLLSLNPTQKHDCPFMKLYRFPSACVCHVE